MRKFGLAAILTFVDKGASAAMGRIGARAAKLKKRFQTVGRGVSQMSRGFGTLAMGMLPVTAGFGLMMKKGADFEQAVARIRAVTLDTTNKTTPALRGLAKTLGATTRFSATEAADAMTGLARAGLTSNQIMTAVKGTLNAAAAEGIGLATAADMVASNIKAFNVPAEQAAAIAGKLALASARTNTNMVGLQEGLKLAAPAAGLVNATLADTTAILGSLADIGLKGTLGGTAFRSAMFKLVNPTKKGKKAVADLGIKMGDLTKLLDKGNVVDTFKLIVGRMKAIPSASKRAGIAARLFGLRGVAMSKALDLSDKNMKRFNETLGMLRKETGGTAKAMAEIQLKTLSGQVTLLKSAFEGLSIEVFDAFSGETTSFVKSFATAIQNVALAMRVVGGEKIIDKDAAKQVREMPKVFFEIARGIREGFSEIKETVKGAIRVTGKFFETLGIGGTDSAKSIAKLVTKIAIFGAVIAPVILAVGMFAKVAMGLGGVILGLKTVFFAIGGILSSLFSLPVVAIGILIALFVDVRSVWNGMVSAFKASGVFDAIKGAVSKLFEAFRNLFGEMGKVGESSAMWTNFGRIVGAAFASLGAVLKTVIDGFTAIINLVREIKSGAVGKTISQMLGGKGFGDVFGPGAPAAGKRPPPRPAKDAFVTTTGMLPVSAGDVLLDRASLAGAITSQLRGGLLGAAGGGALGGGDPGRTSPAPAPAGGGGHLQIQVPVQIDGRQIALAVAEVRLDDLERSGATIRPGARSALLQRGFEDEL